MSDEFTLDLFEKHLPRVAVYLCCMHLSDRPSYHKFFEKCVQDKHKGALETLNAFAFFETIQTYVEKKSFLKIFQRYILTHKRSRHTWHINLDKLSRKIGFSKKIKNPMLSGPVK